MNREIKFRVYDKDLKKMRYLNNSHDFICFDEKGNGYYHNMQTGLGDESSKWDKIYDEYAKSTLKFMQELEQGSDSND